MLKGRNEKEEVDFKMQLEAGLPSVCDFEVPGNSKVDSLSFYHVLQREC